ncbi:MAG: HD domain-containing protein [Pseudomonadota bacterium]
MTPLDQQIRFLLEADVLKRVNRSNILLDHSRTENSAEHSWHVALWALILGPSVSPEADIDRVIAMLLIHDLVEIDVGDHPIHLQTDWGAVAAAEDAAAQRLFGLLPAPQGEEFLALWREFEANEARDAQVAKLIDTAQPMFQTLCGSPPHPDHCAIVAENLRTGRAKVLHRAWPVAAEAAQALLAGRALEEGPFAASLRFLNEADRLKSVIRATLIADASRRENSAEHSWHLALMALILAPDADVSVAQVVRMLLLHDIVEVDAGDTPIFAQYDASDMALQEQAAADRLFGLLPNPVTQEMRAIWDKFEGNTTPEARFAKSLDRFQPPLMNLAAGGGSWVEYNVSFDMVTERVGTKIERGAPWLWEWIEPRVKGFFENHTSRA